MPVDGYLELQAHNDVLFRELELVGIELEGDNAAQVAAPLADLVVLLEQADELCRAGVLLTPEPPPSVQALRRWFVDQMAAQLLHGATPTPPG